MISIDDDAVEEQYLQLASPSDSPEKMFERQWAATLLEQVVTGIWGFNRLNLDVGKVTCN